MKIKTIHDAPNRALHYMERLVNNGSPSNFSFRYMTSKETCPLYVSDYYMCILNDANGYYLSYGDLSSDCLSLDEKRFIYIHPDWKNINTKMDIINTDLIAYPTSSSRTVEIPESSCYIKMAYPGVLGRITRELKTEHILSSIDISSIFSAFIKRNDSPISFAFLPEHGGRVYKKDDVEIGYVIRDSKPMGKKCSEVVAIIPAFSLFSDDRMNSDLPIIAQILKNMNSPLRFLLDELIYPILDCYFYCILQGGVQPEMHSQNFLLGVDSNFHIVSVILRDLESVDKDVSIMQRRKLDIQLLSYPFKCISSDQYNYKIKHSFMYDHKLGEYFFDPLLHCLEVLGFFDRRLVEKSIKSYVRDNYLCRLQDFFPDDGMWYKFENVLIDRSKSLRPYIAFPKPKYR